MSLVKIGVDHIMNGQAYGDVADRLLEANFRPEVLRAWRSTNGRNYVTVNGQHFLTNAPSTLSIDGWRRIDRAVRGIAEPRLRVWGDLVAEGLTLDIPNGMGTTVLTTQTGGDAGAATISMDALKPSERDRQVYDTKNFPLPIIHGEWSFSARQLAVARQSGVPADTRMAERVTRRIVELVESLTLGTAPSYSYGGGTVYGLTNKPERLITTLTLPTAPGWTPEVTYNEILGMIVDLQDKMFNGPYGLYFSPSWVRYFAQDYSAAYPGVTLNSKLREMRDLGLNWARPVRYGLSGFQIVIFQLDSDVVRALNGLDLTTLSWDSKGGLAKNYMTMCIYVPQVDTDNNNVCGVNHGVAA